MSSLEELELRIQGWEGHLAMALWTREDILGQADELEIKITDEEVDQILDDIDEG